MFKKNALEFFGTNTRIALAAGVDPSAVSQWKELVPEGRAQRLADASNGTLHYDKDVYDRYRKAKRLGKNSTKSAQRESE
ncbi:Cro/CI family transcriptional regulator [Yokenella regensburgei]|uniref:Cro/CI family transcriptional regulator n=1 Tax=Yokenella regensburgei TaxID=158877 RepID=UPI00137625F6|nr:Cro/CI family transcriptional regulator [Yokenella regensburgei]KAF1367359.1 DNA-binding transcriptional regulator YdaS (Cro superfamily) [Yokenella regensburgei]